VNGCSIRLFGGKWLKSFFVFALPWFAGPWVLMFDAKFSCDRRHEKKVEVFLPLNNPGLKQIARMLRNNIDVGGRFPFFWEPI